ncbi:hypothetical protein LCGC14_0315830 [marine sediment metagenome]|uniref:Sulfatase-modifying factor enzyme-like domain-containing protein n=1 Tax=marine sediment metagenome TaxID=412755 RepID=A0A0F9U3D4_9ZZZZ|nr:PEP-CTERM sorting domain-containing protein [Phycisphaerae bacterium]HDZ44131.1 PEP-CTERM sorting domain-containing protein [Phycisphaerae bacterium]
MYRQKLLIAATMLGVLAGGAIAGDTFGSGANEFTIDFVSISGDASSANGTGIGGAATFVDPGDFRIGVHEITTDQWTKFVNMAGAPIGSPNSAYNNATGGAPNLPAVWVSSFEQFQFVNWLNLMAGYGDAYKFVETTPGDPATLTFDVWDAADAAGGTNLFRHKDAKYFVPTEDEWVKAAYWNSGDPSNLQTYASVGDVVPVKQVDSQYGSFGAGLWDVGSGTQELNGTYDMMGNAIEYVESPYSRDGVYNPDGAWGVAIRGGSYYNGPATLTVTSRNSFPKYNEQWEGGFRVASFFIEDLGPPGDFDGDGDIDADDVDILCANMGGDPATYDVDEDGDVDEDDMIVLIETLVELTDGVRVGTERGDFNLDGLIDGTDLALMKTAFGLPGQNYADGNANCDAFVDGTDLAILKTNFGFIAPTGGAVPEPVTIGLLSLGGIALLRRKRS